MCVIVHFFRTYCLLLKLDKYNKDFSLILEDFYNHFISKQF